MRGALAAAIPSVVAPLLAIVLSFLGKELPDVTRQTWDSEYDYIVVGAGSAGAVLAARLSEDPSVSVLLLEAGGMASAISEIPVAGPLVQKTELDWSYRTEPQRNACFSLEGRRSTWPRGKALGGSSTINNMLYCRGNRRDYDRWAAAGCDGWAWSDVLPYFLKLEDMRNPELLADGLHSAGGPLTVTQLASPAPGTLAFVESGKYLGYPAGDYNGATQAVFSTTQGTIRDGRRWSVAKAYLLPAAKRPNLHIITHAHVSKILIDSAAAAAATGAQEQPEARGVRFRRDSEDFEVLARKEVIVSAGAINSPQLLMLSGIGPAQHLEAHNISVVVDLPVGDNLQDHIISLLYFTVKKDLFYAGLFNFVQNIFDFAVKGTGPLTTPGGFEGFGFIKTRFVNASDDWPDLQLYTGPTVLPFIGNVFKRDAGLNDDYNDQVIGPYAADNSIIIGPSLLRPKSRGFIRLRTSQFTDAPLIDPRYLSHPDDLETLVQGMKVSLALANMPPLQELEAKPFESRVPGCEQHELYSDDYLRCMARGFTQTCWHPAGTCRMGALDDPRTVVDAQLRVKGVGRLRVVDASVMPHVISGNLNAPTVMIGEKAADMIKAAESAH